MELKPKPAMASANGANNHSPYASEWRRELTRCTQQFALDVIELVETLPRTRTGEVLGRQLMRSATSVGANYRAACRAKSPADFIAKMGIVEEEADESIYWLELLIESGLTTAAAVERLMSEGSQLVTITVSSIKTARTRPK
jgi:four helix bundle protein